MPGARFGTILLSETDENEGGYGFRCPECRDGVWKEDPTGASNRDIDLAAVRA